MNLSDLSTREALRLLLEKHEEDGYRRAVRVIYAKPDGREKDQGATMQWWRAKLRRVS